MAAQPSASRCGFALIFVAWPVAVGREKKDEARSDRRNGSRGKARQLKLAFARFAWGGRRKGAGRKRAQGGGLGHAPRPMHLERHPGHVVMKARYQSLLTQFVFPTVRRALAEATRKRADFRIVQFSVQGDHLHLIVEAGDRVALARGVQGLAIRIARQVNRLVQRSGKLWAERYFARDLSSPRAARSALAYVLNNFRKHRSSHAALIDAYSSAPYFTGFSELRGRAPIELGARLQLLLAPRGASQERGARANRARAELARA